MSTAMWITRPAVAAVLVASMGLPAMAQPIEIATLGRAPVMGRSTNPAELQYNFKHNEVMMRRAATALGLTSDQYEHVRLLIDVAKPNWVTIPRHLDAITWASGGQIHVLRDVIIPANQKGFEVDMQDGNKQLAVFLPAKCGNLSVIRREYHVAQVRNFPVPHPPRYVAYQPPPPVTAYTQPQPPTYVQPIPPPPITVPPPVHHGINLLPLAALLPFVVRSSGSTTPGSPPGGTGTIVGPPPCP
jgi:hypothetical protein